MAHHVEARFDEQDMMFLPPQRTLGFNPQLKLNDSLLAQSYIEAYDISYPEAIRRIETEVAELKQHLDNEGFYELNDLGILSINAEGKLEFEPCEAGILTPERYALSSFEMRLLGSPALKPATTTPAVQAITNEEPAEDAAITNTADLIEDISAEENGDTQAIVIKMSWVRNVVATAAAILLFFTLATPVSNDEPSPVSKSQITLPVMVKDSNVAHKESKLDQQKVKDVLENHLAAQENQKMENTAEQDVSNTPEENNIETTDNYCIVLASQVSKRNAEEFVGRLQKMGLDDARVYIYHNIRRVVCGSFKTEAEAYQQLQKIHQKQSLEDAWVYKVKH